MVWLPICDVWALISGNGLCLLNEDLWVKLWFAVSKGLHAIVDFRLECFVRVVSLGFWALGLGCVGLFDLLVVGTIYFRVGNELAVLALCGWVVTWFWGLLFLPLGFRFVRGVI